MTDLFGQEVTSPKGHIKRETNAMQGFTEFWTAWPKGPRKVAKPQCVAKWAKLGCADRWSHIVAHVTYMTGQSDWQKDGGAFIPQPLTYLNQQRWIDWEPEPVRQKRPDALEVIKAHKGAPIPQAVREKMAMLRRSA